MDLASQRCQIYLYDAHAATGVAPLPPSKVPKSWSSSHRYATEEWLARNLRTHAWRAKDVADADVVFIAATFAQACHSGKAFYGRKLWQAILQDQRLWPNGTFLPRSKERERELRAATAADWGPPKAFSLQYPACPPWVDNNKTAYVPRDAFLLSEYVPPNRAGFASRGIVSPFVVATPRWLASAPHAAPQHETRGQQTRGQRQPQQRRRGDAGSAGSDEYSSSAATRSLARLEQSGAPPLLPWRQRKVALFAGHIPKIHIARARFDIWRQIRNDPRATTKSHSGNCTVGSYITCRMYSDQAWLRTRPNEWFMGRCHDWCGGREHAIKTGLTCSASVHHTQPDNLRRMQWECKPYLKRAEKGEEGLGAEGYAVDLSQSVLADLHRDASKRWSEAEYLEQAMGHKYCLVVQGDFAGTPKIAEMLAMGGAGGCLPVFALRLSSKADTALAMLQAADSEGAPPSHRLSPSTAVGRRARAKLEALVEEGLAAAVRASLPYSRWLDYCTVSVLVSERRARRNATGMLDALEAIPAGGNQRGGAAATRIVAAGVAAGVGGGSGGGAVGSLSVLSRRQTLRRVRHAFGFWEGSSVVAPSATDYIFAEMCAHARRFRGHFGADFKSVPPHAVAASPERGGLRRCLLRV